jgi:arabinofuranosyltransferase
MQQYRRGARYLFEYGRWYGWYLHLLPFGLLLRSQRQRWITFFALNVCVFVAYIIYVGGDGLSFFRFVVPIVPFISLLIQEGFLELYARATASAAWGGVLPIAAATLLVLALGAPAQQTVPRLLFPEAYRWRAPFAEVSFPMLEEGYVWFDNYFVDRLAVAARWLDAHAPPDAVVAATPAGAIAYYMNLRVIDMLGLTDRHIARAHVTRPGSGPAGHEKGDGRYVLSRSPDYILLGNVAVLPRPLDDGDVARKLMQTSERQIWAEPEFHRRYQRVTVKLSDTGPFRYFTFFQKKHEEPADAGQ